MGTFLRVRQNSSFLAAFFIIGLIISVSAVRYDDDEDDSSDGGDVAIALHFLSAQPVG